jgi:hypothetical protein
MIKVAARAFRIDLEKLEPAGRITIFATLTDAAKLHPDVSIFSELTRTFLFLEQPPVIDLEAVPTGDLVLLHACLFSLADGFSKHDCPETSRVCAELAELIRLEICRRYNYRRRIPPSAFN